MLDNCTNFQEVILLSNLLKGIHSMEHDLLPVQHGINIKKTSFSQNKQVMFPQIYDVSPLSCYVLFTTYLYTFLPLILLHTFVHLNCQTFYLSTELKFGYYRHSNLEHLTPRADLLIISDILILKLYSQLTICLKDDQQHKN